MIEGNHSAIMVAGDLNFTKEEIRRKMESSCTLFIRTCKDGTRVQANKWSSLDYFISDHMIEDPIRLGHLSSSDHFPINTKLNFKL